MLLNPILMGLIVSVTGFVTQATPQQIASGKDYWVDSQPDPEFANINARVNLGTLREIERGVYDVDLRWPLGFDDRKSWQRKIPGVVLTPANYQIYRERITCHQDKQFSFSYQSALYDGQGQALKVETKVIALAQRAAEESHAQFLKRLGTTDTVSYGSDPRSLVCWAVAQKCRNQAFYWPPPPNLTPFDSPAIETLLLKYNQQFVPACLIQSHQASSSPK